jgi:outer membrane protein TolC
MQAFKLALWFESPSSMAFNILGGMMMPLLNRRVLKANLMEYTGKKREALLQYEKTILIAYGEVLEWLQQSESLQKMIFLKQEELRLLEESILSVKALYATGRSTYLEKITAQGYYLQTQMELLDLNYRKISAQIGLYKAMGGGL